MLGLPKIFLYCDSPLNPTVKETTPSNSIAVLCDAYTHKILDFVVVLITTPLGLLVPNIFKKWIQKWDKKQISAVLSKKLIEEHNWDFKVKYTFYSFLLIEVTMS